MTLRRAAFYEDAFILEGASERDVQKTSLYEEGGLYLQSLSSMLPPLFVEPKAGESILDMTAAPGGKTTQLSALSGRRRAHHRLRTRQIPFRTAQIQRGKTGRGARDAPE